MLATLDQLVEQEGIVEAGWRLGVNYGTVAKCHDDRQVSRRMREVRQKSPREQGHKEGRKG